MSNDGMKYTFILEDSNSPTREIKHVHAGEQTWPELLQCFEGWLRGCGFQINGHLEFIEDKPQSAAKPKGKVGAYIG
jgi:hypothetical protein